MLLLYKHWYLYLTSNLVIFTLRVILLRNTCRCLTSISVIYCLISISETRNRGNQYSCLARESGRADFNARRRGSIVKYGRTNCAVAATTVLSLSYNNDIWLLRPECVHGKRPISACHNRVARNGIDAPEVTESHTSIIRIAIKIIRMM